MKVHYVVLQDGTREVFRGDTWKEALLYLESVKTEYDDSYRVCLDERNGSLTIQDPYTLEFLVSLCIRIDDNKGSIGSTIFRNIMGGVP